MELDRRILVAEDDADCRRLLTLQLENAGFCVIPCENGRQALEAIKTGFTGLILADWRMPEMDGLELCGAVREMKEQQLVFGLHFILLSANSDLPSIVRGLEAGADDYLTKPYDLPELIARLHCGQRILELQWQLMQRQMELRDAALDISKLNRRLERLANTDTLTGIANRRSFLDQLDRFWALAVRHDRPLTCLAVDVDHFKRVNDGHGHSAGDVALAAIANCAANLVRRSDLLGRMGGEEFSIACPDTNLEGAMQLAERLRVAVEQLQTRCDGVHIPLTVSVGVAARAAAHVEAVELLNDADDALYAAKNAGRNCIRAASDDAKSKLDPFAS